MKGLIIILCATFLLTACNTSNVKEITETSDIPVKVIKATKDTALKFDRQIISTENYMYVLQKTSTETIVEQKIDKNSTDGIAFWIGFFLGMLVLVIIESIIND